MSQAIIELNDSGIRCFQLGIESQDENLQIGSPGYAQLLADQVITGDQARENAYLSPQQTYHQFWDQLSLSPLPQQTQKNASARHYADLAYAHLDQVFQQANRPESVVLAVPGTYSHEQLGILLGLAKAVDMSVVGLVDSALLASYEVEPGDYWHLDVQLHQLIATPISSANQIYCGDAELFPAAGLKMLFDCWAHHIADGFIRHYRYDPLHSAEGEQAIHDHLPGWLEQLKQLPEIDIQLATPQGDYQLRLVRSELIEVVADRYQSVLSSLQQAAGRKVLLSHRLAQLPGFASLFSQGQWLAEQSLLNGFSHHCQYLTATNGEIARVAELPAVTSLNPPKQTADRGWLPLDSQVSHLLCQGQAYPLAESLVLDAASMALNYEQGAAQPLLARRKQGWFLRSGVVEAGHNQGKPLTPGLACQIDGVSLMLIAVNDKAPHEPGVESGVEENVEINLEGVGSG